jgi:erythromycin esterase
MGQFVRRAFVSAIWLGWTTAAATQGPVPANQPAIRAVTPVQEQAAIAWLADHGHPFDPNALSQDDFAPIVAKLSGARIMGIGEATHGTHQDQAFKAELIKALVRAGAIDTFFLECNRAAGAGFDRYVRTGEGDPAALVRSESFFRIWKGDEFAGLLLWLRAWNLQSDRAIGVVGLDNQDAGRDAASALAELEHRDPGFAAQIRTDLGSLIPADGKNWPRFFRWLHGAPHNDFARAYAAVTRLRDRYDADAGKFGSDPAFVSARYAAQVAWQGFNEFELENGTVDVSNMPVEYANRRDRFMAANAVDRLGSARRAALWAHDDHVLDYIPPMTSGANYLTLGTELKHRLGGDYRTVGFTWSRGSVLTTQRAITSSDALAAQPKDEPTALLNDRANELGRVFDGAARINHASAMWAPIREARGTAALDGWRLSDYWRGHLGWLVDPAKWQKPEDRWAMPAGEGFDILVWFARVTPQQRWPGLPVPN